MAQCMADKKDPSSSTKREKCSQIIMSTGLRCPEDAVGKAYLKNLDQWSPYCRRHLEDAKNLKCPVIYFSETICNMPDCKEFAVGKAWDTTRGDRPNLYCREHLEMAEHLGHPIKFLSDTDVTLEWDES